MKFCPLCYNPINRYRSDKPRPVHRVCILSLKKEFERKLTVDDFGDYSVTKGYKSRKK